MKRTLIIIVPVVLALAIAAGSFYGGMAYQRNQANAVRDNFLRSRGLSDTNPGTFPGGSNAPTGNFSGGGFPGGGITGQVKSIDGNTITLSFGQNETKVTTSDSTVIEKTVNGAASDLQSGQQVMVTGTRDANGNITASQVLILGNSPTTGSTTP